MGHSVKGMSMTIHLHQSSSTLIIQAGFSMAPGCSNTLLVLESCVEIERLIISNKRVDQANMTSLSCSYQGSCEIPTLLPCINANGTLQLFEYWTHFKESKSWSSMSMLIVHLTLLAATLVICWLFYTPFPELKLAVSSYQSFPHLIFFPLILLKTEHLFSFWMNSTISSPLLTLPFTHTWTTTHSAIYPLKLFIGHSQ